MRRKLYSPMASAKSENATAAAGSANLAARGPLTPVRTGRFERSREVVKRWWTETFGIRPSSASERSST